MTGTKKKEANFGDWDRPPNLSSPKSDMCALALWSGHLHHETQPYIIWRTLASFNFMCDHLQWVIVALGEDLLVVLIPSCCCCFWFGLAIVVLDPKVIKLQTPKLQLHPQVCKWFVIAIFLIVFTYAFDKIYILATCYRYLPNPRSLNRCLAPATQRVTNTYFSVYTLLHSMQSKG